jgi:NADH-quinone oxidoreductase subunit M
MNAREIISLIPLIILIFWIGIFPSTFFGIMEPSVQALVNALPAVAMK